MYTRNTRLFNRMSNHKTSSFFGGQYERVAFKGQERIRPISDRLCHPPFGIPSDKLCNFENSRGNPNGKFQRLDQVFGSRFPCLCLFGRHFYHFEAFKDRLHEGYNPDDP